MASYEDSPFSADDNCIRSSIVADPHQRRLLAVLQAESRPLTERDLAVQLARRQCSPPNVTEDVIERLLVKLRHCWLPKLDAVGWIERHPNGIVATERFPFGKPTSSLPPLDDADVRWERLAAVIARPHRKHVLSVFVSEGLPLYLDELTAVLEAHDRVSLTNESGDHHTLSTYLHHVDLPRLDDVGLIQYDPRKRTIAHPSSPTGPELTDCTAVRQAVIEVEQAAVEIE